MRKMLIAAVMIGAGDAEQLRITVYDKAQLPPPLSLAVFDELRRIFRVAGISIEWVAGNPTASEASLMVYQPPRRGQEREDACRARRDIALEILSGAPGVKRNVLGMAQPLARAGLNVRVFDDHVRSASEMNNQEHAVVLGYAIAHEIGHVLLRSHIHSGRGLMSDVWTSREYEPIAKGALFFTADEYRKMRITLRGATCPPP